MKKILLAAMITSLLILPTQGAVLADEPEAVLPQESFSQELEFVPGDVPAETGVLDSLSPAIHAVVLGMLSQEQSSLTADPTLNWEILYNMLSLYGQMDERSLDQDDDLVLPAELAADFSSVLVPDFDQMGQLPDTLSDRMVYDPESDSYSLACGDDSLAQVILDAPSEEGGDLTVTGSLVYQVDSSTLAQFRVTLTPADNMFGYRIAGLDLI